MRKFDYIIIGSGLAGLYAAYKASFKGSVAVITKTLLRDEWKYDGFVMTDWWAKITDLDGNESSNDYASMVKAVNDVYMVMENAKDHNDNLEPSLENGYLTRAELQVCAINICNFVMYTHAYERFKANGFKYALTDLDTTNMNEILVLENIELDEPSDVKFEKSGKYILEIEFTSPLPELAQISIDAKIDLAGACTAVAKGTNGKKGIIKTPISIMNWAKKIVFSSTAATYGEPESIPILETDRTLPTNCYGETKLAMEKMFLWTIVNSALEDQRRTMRILTTRNGMKY